MTRSGERSRLLALDFDGVVADALLECAAVTYFGSVGPPRAERGPRLAEALAAVPESFVERFRAIRPFCRTLSDFMTVHASESRVSTRSEFERLRDSVPTATLQAQAAAGEAHREMWRTMEPGEWLASHRLNREVIELLERWDGPRWIISAKDSESIADILAEHDVLRLVDHIAGSCDSKVPALSAASQCCDVVFVDDNLDNVVAAGSLPQVEPIWATWGYHTTSDAQRAKDLGLLSLDLESIHSVTYKEK